MVPEIALTPQTARRFEERFGDRVAILHSKLGLGERYDEWQRLRSGAARICVGPRSAVFAPLATSACGRRRGARLRVQAGERSALRRARRRGAPRAAGRRGAALRERDAAARELAAHAAAVAPAAGRRPRAAAGRAARHARAAARAAPRCAARARGGARARGRRRSCWSPGAAGRRSSIAATAGAPGCARSCDVSLTLHREGDAQRLSATTAVTPSPRRMPARTAGRRAVARHGVGTQRLEAELREALAPLPVFRLDADAGAAQGRHRVDPATASTRAPAGILVGTQMVAQGHDFPEVELAVVQDADATCASPTSARRSARSRWWRSSPAAAGAGRAGGRVLVQTLCPRHRSLRHAAAPRRRRLPRGGGGAPARAALSALLHPDRGDGGRSRPAVGGRARPSCSGARLLRRPRRARARAAVPRSRTCAAATLVVKTDDREAAVAAVGEAVQSVAARAHAARREARGRRRPAVNASDAGLPVLQAAQGARDAPRQPRARPSRSRTRFPVSPGHCLVVPRRHEPDFFKLSREEQEDIWELVWELRELLEAEHDTTSFNVGINAGEAAGQIVPHAHVHVIPRYPGDEPDPRGGVRWVIPDTRPVLGELAAAENGPATRGPLLDSPRDAGQRGKRAAGRPCGVRRGGPGERRAAAARPRDRGAPATRASG